VSKVPRFKLRKGELLIILIYASTLFATGVIVQEIRKLTGISLVADEGVFLTYSHYLAGLSLTEIEQQHFAGYGQFYWIKCFFLVFPGSLVNRIGITEVESLRLVVWIFGAFTCLALLRLAKRNNVNHLKVLFVYLGAFPLGAMIRYSGIKDSIVSGLLLLLFIFIGKIALIDKFQLKVTKHYIGIVLVITSFFFIQHNFIPILCASFLLVAALKRKVFLAYVSIGAIVIYGFLSLSVGMLSKNTSDSIEILDFSNILSVKSVPGGSLIPESFVQRIAPESFVQRIAPESFVQSIVPDFMIQQPVNQQAVNQQPILLNAKIFHLFYINFSNFLSAIVSFEGLVWLVILVFLIRALSKFKSYPTEVVMLVSICLLSYFGILMYDENFGTFLRHRSQLAVATIYCLLRIRSSRVQI
jgi:hypothetical protein